MNKARENNIIISDRVHYAIPDMVRDIVEGHLKANEGLMCQHNREILDEIIADLEAYRRKLPTVLDLEVCGVI